MKGAIFYATKYGSTAQYAEWIGAAAGLPVFNIREAEGDPASFDFLVLGSPVIYFKLPIRHWVKRHLRTLESRPMLFFTVSGAPAGEKLDGWIAGNLPSSLIAHMDHVALQGRQNPADLTAWDRAMLIIGSWFNRDPEASRDEREGFDYMDESAIAPIVAWARQKQEETKMTR